MKRIYAMTLLWLFGALILGSFTESQAVDVEQPSPALASIFARYL